MKTRNEQQQSLSSENKQENEKKETYTPPQINVVEVKVEQGFASSIPGWDDPQNW